MNTPRTLPFVLRLPVLVALTGLFPVLSAATLMLDFGPIAVTGAEKSVSPCHSVTPAFTDTTWNQVQTTAVSAGLLYSDGTAATGVSVSVGRSSSLAWQILTFDGAPSSATLATGSYTGVFAGSSAGRDAIVHGSDSSTSSVVGVSIGGLPPGKYDVYVVGYNTNKKATDAAAMGFWALATPGTANLDTTAYLFSPQATSTNSATSAWVQGSNYAKLTVTLISPRSYLTVFSHGITLAEERAFLNSIQVVPVSSPSPAFR